VKGAIALAVLKLALKLDLGPEYDSNANRAELLEGRPTNGDTPTGSALVRTTTKMSLSWQKGISLLRVSGGLGAKVFFNPEVQDQNTLVGQLAVDERLAVGRIVDLGVALDYFDAGQLAVPPPCAPICERHRDFRTGSGTARLTLLDQHGDFTLIAGYRGFQYKPDPAFSFQAVHAGVLATAHLESVRGAHMHEVGFAAAYHLEYRWFAGDQDELRHDFTEQQHQCGPDFTVYADCIRPKEPLEQRHDWFHDMSFEISYVGPLLFSTGYGVQLNLSDSFGSSLLRHGFTARLAARLFWQIYGTVKAQVFYNSFLDPVLLGTTAALKPVSLEDENRNAFIVDLERPIGKSGVAVVARYSVYTNELASRPVEFIRHVVYLGVSYNVGWRWGKNRPPAP
jgi:hypothetical protein